MASTSEEVEKQIEDVWVPQMVKFLKSEKSKIDFKPKPELFITNLKNPRTAQLNSSGISACKLLFGSVPVDRPKETFHDEAYTDIVKKKFTDLLHMCWDLPQKRPKSKYEEFDSLSGSLPLRKEKATISRWIFAMTKAIEVFMEDSVTSSALGDLVLEALPLSDNGDFTSLEYPADNDKVWSIEKSKIWCEDKNNPEGYAIFQLIDMLGESETIPLGDKERIRLAARTKDLLPTDLGKRKRGEIPVPGKNYKTNLYVGNELPILVRQITWSAEGFRSGRLVPSPVY